MVVVVVVVVRVVVGILLRICSDIYPLVLMVGAVELAKDTELDMIDFHILKRNFKF